MRLTNEHRASQTAIDGIARPELTANGLLHAAAQEHSEDMANQDFFDHYNPVEKNTFDQRIKTAGYDFSAAGENIAAGTGLFSPQKVVDAWIASPGHNENLLDPRFTELGVGYHFLANDTGKENHYIYWTQKFGNPK
ncbi:CAP domain-containing protein [Oscillatoriales cyanobacterium LEGE 11467]|uniref:CAP domain-containing protein n=1 Tax=Zarconia navalis LEGE 11467 TaxID=1828826 RepID=A0A928Z9B4_9CYAN|nr:CAP domain-containing protein [Zarconia navalis]MBE9041514.1 CAP domain-containing protein [Zarconia navalis LEGE 11467]